MNLFSTLLPTPIGRLQLVCDGASLLGVLLPVETAPAAREDSSHPLLVAASSQLREYFEGRRTRFELPLRAAGTPFQQSVWGALAEIPFGETRSYGELARRLGRPGASRAVGAANGRNPLSIVVPCHRVIGSDGSLTGYAGGQPAKQWLLDHETRVSGRLSPESTIDARYGFADAGRAFDEAARPGVRKVVLELVS